MSFSVPFSLFPFFLNRISGRSCRLCGPLSVPESLALVTRNSSWPGSYPTQVLPSSSSGPLQAWPVAAPGLLHSTFLPRVLFGPCRSGTGWGRGEGQEWSPGTGWRPAGVTAMFCGACQPVGFLLCGNVPCFRCHLQWHPV